MVDKHALFCTIQSGAQKLEQHQSVNADLSGPACLVGHRRPPVSGVGSGAVGFTASGAFAGGLRRARSRCPSIRSIPPAFRSLERRNGKQGAKRSGWKHRWARCPLVDRLMCSERGFRKFATTRPFSFIYVLFLMCFLGSEMARSDVLFPNA